MPKDEEVWKAAHAVIDRIADDRWSASAPIVSIASTEERSRSRGVRHLEALELCRR
jgi:hypothetical protein